MYKDATERVLCFDLGWTLEDESDAQEDRATRAAKIAGEHGFSLSVEEIIQRQKEAGSRGEAAVFPVALADLGVAPDLIQRINREAPWDPSLIKLYDGATELVRELSEGYDLLIISNQSKPATDRLNNYGITGLFEHILCSCEVGFSKPDRRIFHFAEGYYFYKNVQLWMIGDRADNDIAPAKALGWKTIRLLQGDHAGYKPRNPLEKADYEVGSLEELKEIF